VSAIGCDRDSSLSRNDPTTTRRITHSPLQRLALDQVDAEFANLRAGLYWAAGRGDIDTATRIAAHTAMFTEPLQRFEAVGWAEELLAAASAVDVPQLPRLYAAAALCCLTGQPDTGLDYARRAAELDCDPKYDPLVPSWAEPHQALAHSCTGNVEMTMTILQDLAGRDGLQRVFGLALQAWALPAWGRREQARTVADEAVTTARGHGNPFLIRPRSCRLRAGVRRHRPR